jgi:hypothetical protein
MNVSDLNISDLNVSDISVSTLNVGDIVIDEAEVTTLRFDDVTNANYSEIQRDNDTLTIAGGYLNAQGTQFNGDIAFTPYNLSNATPPSMVVQASDGKVYIPNMSALDINTSTLEAINITASSTIAAPTMNTSTLNVSTINVDTDIDVPDINTSQINASNISVDVDLTVAGTTQTDVLEADIISAGCDMTNTLETSSNMYYPNNLLIDYSAPQVATTIELSSNLSLNGIDLLPDLVTAADPTLSMLSGTAQITNANISTLTCDLTPNLTAGTGITITSVGGKPTIASTGYVTDPLNVSQLNASNASIDADLSVVGTATITDAAITTLTCDLTPNLTAGTGITITSVGGLPTISSTTVITDPLNVSTLNASQINASYGYVRWDMNVSNTLYTTANVDAGNSIFANANMVAGGNVTSTGYNFKRTVADGGLTMANIFANANSLDMAMSYDWNIYKSNNTGVRMMQFDFSAGNVNMSNASINNLSVISTITTPDATITDLVIPGTVSIPGILNHDFSKNVTAGAGINITHVGNQMTIAATASGVTDPLNLSTLNASQANASNISVGTIQPGLINASVTNTEFLNVSGSAAFLADGLTVYGQTALQNTSITNLSTTTLTCDLTPNLTAGTGITITSVGGKPTITATGGSVTDPLNLSKLNASNISVDAGITTATLAATGNILTEDSFTFRTDAFTAFTITNNTNPNEYRLSTTSSNQDIRICNATGAGGLLFDAGNNDINISQLNASNIDVDADITTDTLTCDLTPNLTAGTGISITSVGNKPTITAVNSVSANVPVSDFIETLQIIPSGTIPFLNQGINQMSLDINVHDYQGGTAYSPSNMFTVNAGDKIVFNWKQSGWVQTAPGAQASFICYLVSGVGAATSANRIPVGRIYQYIYSQSDHEEITGSFVYYVSSTFSFYRSQIEGTSGLVTQGQDYGAATATVYRATIPNSIVIPQTLNASNISVENDVTITRDLDVDRYLSYKPRFLTRWRDNVYGITGTAQDVQWNRDETAMAGGALQVSGDGIQALLAGWYKVDWSIGYRKMNNTGGERLTARTYLRINNVFYGKYGFGSSTYLRSSTINCVGYSSGSQLVYADTNDIIHIRTDCIIQGNTDFTSDFGGQRILASSRFSCEYVSNSGET